MIANYPKRGAVTDQLTIWPLNPNPRFCDLCRKWWRETEQSRVTNCAVVHGPGSCCHYLMEETGQPPSTLQTRGEAEVKIRPDRKRLQNLVFACIREHGPITDAAGAELAGLPENTYRPRRLELHRAGKIKAVGYSRTKSGRKAVAWAVVRP